MRPVNRGEAPGTYTDHALAKPDLTNVLGNYCSYCERPFPEDVEHKLPKNAYTDRRLSWNNFLLACKSCNDTKGEKPEKAPPREADADLAMFLWPDTDNTARAFIYKRYEIGPAEDLSPGEQTLAHATMDLTGFHKTPGSSDPPTSPKDRRWFFRDQAWSLAEHYREKLSAEPINASLREAVSDVARQNGFWSVWRVVFAADPEMLRLLDDAFPGTAPQQRPGGRP